MLYANFGDDGAELLQNLQSHRLALLRVILGGEDVAASDGGGELHPIVGGSGGESRVGGYDVIRVYEVHEGAVIDTSQQRRVLAFADLIPPHVRDLQTRPVREAYNAARED